MGIFSEEFILIDQEDVLGDFICGVAASCLKDTANINLERRKDPCQLEPWENILNVNLSLLPNNLTNL